MNEKNKVLIALVFLFAVMFAVCAVPIVKADTVIQERTVIGRLFQHWEMSGDNEVTQDIKFYTGLNPADYQAVYGSEGMDANFWWHSWKKSFACLNGDRKECMHHIENALPYQMGFIMTVMTPVINELRGMIITNQLEIRVNEYAFICYDDFKDKCNDDRLCIWCNARYKVMKEYQIQYKLTEMEFLYGNSGNSCYPFREILKE